MPLSACPQWLACFGLWMSPLCSLVLCLSISDFPPFFFFFFSSPLSLLYLFAFYSSSSPQQCLMTQLRFMASHTERLSRIWPVTTGKTNSSQNPLHFSPPIPIILSNLFNNSDHLFPHYWILKFLPELDPLLTPMLCVLYAEQRACKNTNALHNGLWICHHLHESNKSQGVCI